METSIQILETILQIFRKMRAKVMERLELARLYAAEKGTSLADSIMKIVHLHKEGLLEVKLTAENGKTKALVYKK